MSREERHAIANKLWNKRRALQLTQKEMALRIGISRERLSRAEHGKFSSERSLSVFLIRKYLGGVK